VISHLKEMEDITSNTAHQLKQAREEVLHCILFGKILFSA
jgi:hypothetical protein